MVATIKHDLQRTTPEQQGISSSALIPFIEALNSQIHELHSVMLMRHGCVVAEGWWSPYGREHPHMLFSLSKSFTSTAVGLAVSEGHFSIDDLVVSFFPDEMPAEVNDFLAAMRVRHLLSMSTGHAEDTMLHLGRREDGNWLKAFFAVPVLHEPGTHFLYNTGATYILSAIVQKATGQKLIDYLEPRLFTPLGIENATWQDSPQGINTGGFGLNTKTEDIARFGQLYLQKGMWEDRRLVPKAWIEEATAFQVPNGNNKESDWNQGYGYQFWRCRHDAYRGDGAFGQYCIVMPEQDAVLAITSGVGDMQQPLNIVWDLLLPAMGADSLPDDAAAQERLTKTLAGLSLPPVQGQAVSPISSQVSDQTYRFDANELRIETASLSFSEFVNTITIKIATQTHTIPCGYGVWQPSQTAMLNPPWESDTKPVVTSGAWTTENTFTVVSRLYETPFFYTLKYHFVGDKLTIEVRVNVGFEVPKTIVLIGDRESAV